MKRWRIIENKWNLRTAPWREAIGIEEVDDEEEVPGVICWFKRWPMQRELVEHVVRLHNAYMDGLGECE